MARRGILVKAAHEVELVQGFRVAEEHYQFSEMLGNPEREPPVTRSGSHPCEPDHHFLQAEEVRCERNHRPGFVAAVTC